MPCVVDGLEDIGFQFIAAGELARIRPRPQTQALQGLADFGNDIVVLVRVGDEDFLRRHGAAFPDPRGTL